MNSEAFWFGAWIVSSVLAVIAPIVARKSKTKAGDYPAQLEELAAANRTGITLGLEQGRAFLVARGVSPDFLAGFDAYVTWALGPQEAAPGPITARVAHDPTPALPVVPTDPDGFLAAVGVGEVLATPRIFGQPVQSWEQGAGEYPGPGTVAARKPEHGFWPDGPNAGHTRYPCVACGEFQPEPTPEPDDSADVLKARHEAYMADPQAPWNLKGPHIMNAQPDGTTVCTCGAVVYPAADVPDVEDIEFDPEPEPVTAQGETITVEACDYGDGTTMHHFRQSGDRMFCTLHTDALAAREAPIQRYDDLLARDENENWDGCDCEHAKNYNAKRRYNHPSYCALRKNFLARQHFRPILSSRPPEPEPPAPEPEPPAWDGTNPSWKGCTCNYRRTPSAAAREQHESTCFLRNRETV